MPENQSSVARAHMVDGVLCLVYARPDIHTLTHVFAHTRAHTQSDKIFVLKSAIFEC